MDTMQGNSSSEARNMAIAILVLVLSIFAIAAFALSSMALFYLLAVVAIAMGFYMAYSVSRESKSVQQKAEKGKRR